MGNGCWHELYNHATLAFYNIINPVCGENELKNLKKLVKKNNFSLQIIVLLIKFTL